MAARGASAAELSLSLSGAAAARGVHAPPDSHLLALPRSPSPPLVPVLPPHVAARERSSLRPFPLPSPPGEPPSPEATTATLSDTRGSLRLAPSLRSLSNIGDLERRASPRHHRRGQLRRPQRSRQADVKPRASPSRSSWCPRLCSREDEYDRCFDLRCAKPLGLASIWLRRDHRCNVDSSAPEYLKFVYTRLPSTSMHGYRQVPRGYENNYCRRACCQVPRHRISFFLNMYDYNVNEYHDDPRRARIRQVSLPPTSTTTVAKTRPSRPGPTSTPTSCVQLPSTVDSSSSYPKRTCTTTSTTVARMPTSAMNLIRSDNARSERYNRRDDRP
ncbi:uncharacterized protein LOC119283396 [Triticum dicoccoides]|uniref:uncharacterized protein LOC119283396 n=1 Tax=Triticum dicoccoides TaxID=85692 RepID=UPI00188EC002|nr:uncharacterized protein LOC119283396 [Triticum dicoccoides]